MRFEVSLSSALLNDDTRRVIFAEVEELEAACARIVKFSDAALRICYAKLEREIVRRAANASHVAGTSTPAEQPQDLNAAATEPTSNEATAMASAPTSTALTTSEPTPTDPISRAPSMIEPKPKVSTPNAPLTIDPIPRTSTIDQTPNVPTDPTSTTPTSIDPASSDRPSDDSTSTALTTEPTCTNEATAIDLPFAEAKERKEREMAALERDYLARLLAAANGNVSRAARLAGKDRSNFKRRLQEHGLRPRGTLMTTSRKIEDAAKHTDTIVEILASNPQGLRTYEIAKEIKQAVGNAHNLLKLLAGQGRIARHGKRYNTLWTLADGTPVPRVETIPQAALAVVAQAMGPVDGRRLRDEMSSLLLGAGKSPSKPALRRAISRLVLSGVLACVGANEHGAMYMLGPTREESELN